MYMCHTTSCPSIIPRPRSAQEESGNKTTSCSLLDSSVAVKHDPVVAVGHEVDEHARKGEGGGEGRGKGGWKEEKMGGEGEKEEGRGRGIGK